MACGPAALAAVPPVPAAPLVERLCPGVEGNALVFGADRAAIADAALAQAGERGADAGFEDRTALYTAWSGRLFAVDYTLDVPGGEPLGEWGDAFGERLAAAGWTVSEDGSMPFADAHFVKEVAGPDGPRVMTLGLDLHGERRGITLRCSDTELELQDRSEREGVLPAGSPRPVPPPPSPPIEAFLERLDCADPALLDLFARAEDLDDAGALVEARLGPPADLNAEADYRHRLLTWVRWRLLASERIDEEALRAIEEQALAREPVAFAEIGEFMAALGGVVEAQQARDSGRLCKAYRDAVATMAAQNAKDARRDAALAALFEEEAARRGIALD